MKQKMIYAIIGLILITILASCFAFKKQNRKLFYKWNTYASAPRNFEADLLCFWVKYGKNSAATVWRKNCCYGIASSIEHTENTVHNQCPTGVDVVWSSPKERKFYKAEIDFTNEEKACIIKLLSSTITSAKYNGKCVTSRYYDSEGNSGIRFDRDNYADMKYKAEKSPFRKFIVCCLPDGKIKFMIEDGNYTCVKTLDFCYQADETHDWDPKILHGLPEGAKSESGWWKNTDEFFAKSSFKSLTKFSFLWL